MAYTYTSNVFGGGLYSAADDPESTRISAWGFSINGHEFMFVDNGVRGTLVFDISTGQWASWMIEGSVGLGFKDGQSFDEFNLLGDPASNVIYTLDPDEVDDTVGSFTSAATGGTPLRRRVTQPCYAVYVEGGRSDEEAREISLYSSDDNGVTWKSHGTQTITGDIEVAWRSLGLVRAPGRVFEIQDKGVFSSLGGLDMSTNE